MAGSIQSERDLLEAIKAELSHVTKKIQQIESDCFQLTPLRRKRSYLEERQFLMEQGQLNFADYVDRRDQPFDWHSDSEMTSHSY